MGYEVVLDSSEFNYDYMLGNKWYGIHDLYDSTLIIPLKISLVQTKAEVKPSRFHDTLIMEYRFCAYDTPAHKCRPTKLGTLMIPMHASIEPECRILPENHINFGEIETLEADLHAVGAISVKCQEGFPYQVYVVGSLEDGNLIYSDEYRDDYFDINKIKYEIYPYSGSEPVQPHLGTDILVGEGEITGTTDQIHAIHARIPAQEIPGGGSYKDQLLVELRY